MKKVLFKKKIDIKKFIYLVLKNLNTMLGNRYVPRQFYITGPYSGLKFDKVKTNLG